MRALLDINVLLALFDPAHTFHNKAIAWWSENELHGWSSSPLTENGFLRIVSQPGYARPVLLPDALKTLREWAVPPRHAFWPDDVSILDGKVFDYDRLLGPRQITDVYLLALAVKNGGRLVTFDRGVALRAVKGAQARHLVAL